MKFLVSLLVCAYTALGACSSCENSDIDCFRIRHAEALTWDLADYVQLVNQWQKSVACSDEQHGLPIKRLGHFGYVVITDQGAYLSENELYAN